MGRGHRNLVSKAVVFVEHVKTGYLMVGEELTKNIERINKLYAELGV